MAVQWAAGTILVAEDDDDDFLLMQEALGREFSTALRRVRDGSELLDYLRHQGKYADPSSSPRPQVVLLDLNMPKKDGREALAEIKSERALRLTPVVVLTTSQAQDDVRLCHELGANAYVTKPADFVRLGETLRALAKFWLETAKVPR
jgi:CheY-like chemotaxis protein